MKEKKQEKGATLEEIMGDEAKLSDLVEELAKGTRRERQQAAHTVADIARQNPQVLGDHVHELIDALNRPEAQTRWEILDALTELVPYESRACEKVIAGAEAALFDESSGPLRLAAMRFLCKYGATTEARSEKTWSLIDEGIQCYHGDIEFLDMLAAVLDFSTGKLSDAVKQDLAARMEFDAENGKGVLGRRAAQILENVT